MKNPYYTFISPDNYYANPDDINPQLLSESLKSYRSEATARNTEYHPDENPVVYNRKSRVRKPPAPVVMHNSIGKRYAVK